MLVFLKEFEQKIDYILLYDYAGESAAEHTTMKI